MEISQKVLVDMHSTFYESLNVSASNKNKSGFRILESILKDYCNRKNASISENLGKSGEVNKLHDCYDLMGKVSADSDSSE